MNKNVMLIIGAVVGVVVLILTVNSCNERAERKAQEKQAQKILDQQQRQMDDLQKQYRY